MGFCPIWKPSKFCRGYEPEPRLQPLKHTMQPSHSHLTKNSSHFLGYWEEASCRFQLRTSRSPFTSSTSGGHILFFLLFSRRYLSPFPFLGIILSSTRKTFDSYSKTSYKPRKHERTDYLLGVDGSGKKCIKEKAQVNISNQLYCLTTFAGVPSPHNLKYLIKEGKAHH